MLKRSRSNQTATKLSVISTDELSVAGKTYSNEARLATHYESPLSAHQIPTKTFTSSSFNSFDLRSKETPFRYVVTNKSIAQKAPMREIVKLPPIEPVPVAKIIKKELTDDAILVTRFVAVALKKAAPMNLSSLSTSSIKRSQSEIRSKRTESEPRRTVFKLQPAETRHSIDASGVELVKRGQEVQNDEYFEVYSDGFGNEEAMVETLAKSEGNYKYVATSTSKLAEGSPFGTMISEASVRLPPIKVDANESVYRFYERRNL